MKLHYISGKKSGQNLDQISGILDPGKIRNFFFKLEQKKIFFGLITRFEDKFINTIFLLNQY